MGWLAPRPGRFNPGKETRYPLYRRLCGPQGRSWTAAENLTTTGIRSPDRPALSESLYQLSYPGALCRVNERNFLKCWHNRFVIFDTGTVGIRATHSCHSMKLNLCVTVCSSLGTFVFSAAFFILSLPKQYMCSSGWLWRVKIRSVHGAGLRLLLRRGT
jgi:hypothetical protein